MSFSIGPSSSGLGPRSLLEDFGSAEGKGGDVYNPHVVQRMLSYLAPHNGAWWLRFCSRSSNPD